MATPTSGARFCGREFTPSEMDLIREVVETCSGLSRMELAQTVCELVRWQRASGGLKARECREFLEGLESNGVLQLPAKRPGKPVGTRTRVPVTANGDPREGLVGEVREFGPIVLEAVRTEAQRLLFRNWWAAITTWGMRCRSGRTCATWRTCRGRCRGPSGRSWAACSSRAPPGGWRCGIAGSGGTSPRDNATCNGW